MNPPRPVPVAHEAVAEIPTDLPLVIRIDVRRLQAALPEPIFSLFLDLATEAAGLTTFRDALGSTRILWLGLRPVSDGAGAEVPRFDYVAVLEGSWDPAGRAWAPAFFSPRELGGGYLRFDARQASSRESPGRVYEFAGERLIIASAVEVDAAERVVEHNQHRRTLVPLEQGAFSVSLDLGRLARLIEESSPRSALIFEQAAHATGYVKLSRETAEFHGRVQFLTAEDARLAEQALSIVLIQLRASVPALEGLRLQVAEQAVTFDFDVALVQLLTGLGFG